MPRKIAIPSPTGVVVGTEGAPPQAALRKQSQWSRDKWEPGMVPNRPLRTVHSGPGGDAYGESMGVRPPMRRSEALPNKTPGDGAELNPPGVGSRKWRK